MKSSLVIIGSGLAGYMLAKEWRKLDSASSLVLITKSQGDFYSKPLLSTALSSKKTPEDLAITRVADMQQQLQARIYSSTTVTGINPADKSIQLNQATLSYDRLVLACGAEPLRARLSGNAIDEVFSINDLEAYADFRTWLANGKKHIVILGSGLVGCEFANDLINAGYTVEIVSMDAHPLTRLVPEKIARELQQAFASQGVSWHFNCCATSVDRQANGYQVGLDDGRVLQADGVISAIGLRPNIDLAKQAGLTTRQGIVVDRLLCTSEQDIYALGDCAEVEGEVRQYVAPLLQCARALAKNLSGESVAVHYPAMPIVVKTPCCPLVVAPVPENLAGHWVYEGDAQHMRALFYDAEQQLRGFALIGEKVRDKMELAKQLPLVFANTRS